MSLRNLRISSSLAMEKDGDILRLRTLCPPVPHIQVSHPITKEEASALSLWLEDWVKGG